MERGRAGLAADQQPQLLAPNDRVDHRDTATVGEVFSRSCWHLKTVASIPLLIPTFVVVVVVVVDVVTVDDGDIALLADGTKFAIFSLKIKIHGSFVVNSIIDDTH